MAAVSYGALPECRPNSDRLGEQHPRMVHVGGEQMRLCGRHERRVAPRVHGASWATAVLASAIICSGPAAHITARSMARAESNDAVPSIGTWSNDAASTVAAHRSAAAVCPVSAVSAVSAVTQPASTASGGSPSTAESPSAESHRWTVDIWPALYVGNTRLVTSWTHRSRSVVFSRCSTARPGDPFDWYQSAARRCSFQDRLGLDAAQLPE